MVAQIFDGLEHFKAADGSPLENGSIYIGAADQNPETNPIQVYTDSGLTQTISQPIKTLAGRPVGSSGAPVRLFVSGAYSVTVKNKIGVLISNTSRVDNSVYSADDSAKLDGVAVPFGKVSDLVSDTNDHPVGTYAHVKDGDFTYIVVASGGDLQNSATTPVQFNIIPMRAGANGGIYNVRSANILGDGVTDVTTNIQAVIDRVDSNGGGEVFFPDGTYIITAPLIKPANVSLVGQDKKKINVNCIISKTTNTVSAVESNRSTNSTNFGDGQDGVDFFPNCIIHCTADDATAGNSRGYVTGLTLNGNSVCDYGLYGSRLPQSAIEYNKIEGVDYGILIWNSIYVGQITGNVINGCVGGIGVDTGTSLLISNNYINTFSEWAYLFDGLSYCKITNNAADSGAVSATGSYAIAYKMINCDGCSIESNGSEVLNGTFIHDDRNRSCKFENNYCIEHNITYTGGDNVGVFYLNFPTSTHKSNRVTVDPAASGASNRWNVYVDNTYSELNWLWEDNMIVNNDSGFNTDLTSLNEGYGRVNIPNGNYGTGLFDLVGDLEVWVRNAGSNANSGLGSSANAVMDIQQIINRLPKKLNNTVTINIGSSTITENVTVQGFSGSGKIIISGNGSASYTGRLIFENNTVKCDVTGAHFEPSEAGTAISYKACEGSVYSAEYTRPALGNYFITLLDDAKVYLDDNTYNSTNADTLRVTGKKSLFQFTQAELAKVSGNTVDSPFGVHECYATIFYPGDGTPKWTSGAGTPEGAVTAVVGSLFTRTDGGASTTLYVKESGTSNTGWVAK